MSRVRKDTLNRRNNTSRHDKQTRWSSKDIKFAILLDASYFISEVFAFRGSIATMDSLCMEMSRPTDSSSAETPEKSVI